MAAVTTHYNITGSVPFLDVNVDIDNYMFVDAFAIRMGLGPKKATAAANHCTESFFDEVTRSVLSTNGARRARGLRLLQQFEEPRETRLGMAANGFDGHGGAEGVGQLIWDVLKGDAEALVRIGIFKHLEDMPLFVHGIGNDITSDLTTRVIFKPLADFTMRMVRRFPALAGDTGIQHFDRQIWEPATLSWTTASLPLPTVDDSPLLLVPRKWTRHDLLLNGGRFYDTTLLSHVQEENAALINGRWIKTPKDKLRDEPSLIRSYETIIRLVKKASDQKVDLVEAFKEFARERYVPTPDELVARRTR